MKEFYLEPLMFSNFNIEKAFCILKYTKQSKNKQMRQLIQTRAWSEQQPQNTS